MLVGGRGRDVRRLRAQVVAEQTFERQGILVQKRIVIVIVLGIEAGSDSNGASISGSAN